MTELPALQRVYEKNHYGQDAEDEKVGVRIGDRVVWLGFCPCFGKREDVEEYRKWEAVASEIVRRCTD